MLTRLQKRLREEKRKKEETKKQREETKKKMDDFKSRQMDRRIEERLYGKKRPMTPIEREKQDKEDQKKDASTLGKIAGRDCSKGKIQYEKDNPGTVYAFGQPIVAKSSLPSVTTRRPTCKNCCEDLNNYDEYYDGDKRKIFRHNCLSECAKQNRLTRWKKAAHHKKRTSRQTTPGALENLIKSNLVIQENENNVFDETKEVLRKLKRTGTPNNNRTKVGLPPRNKNYHLKF